MKRISFRILSLLCAVILMTCAVSVLAEETPATPTDLQPAGSEKEAEDAISSIEVIITKTLTIGESWSGRMKKTKPAVLKLDVSKPGPVYVLVEGKEVWATVEKSDRMTENPTRTQTNPETNRMILSWEAEEGSYLITLGPVEPNLLAMADVTVMNQEAYDAWEAEQEEEPAEDGTEEPVEEQPAEELTDEEPAEEQENGPESETETERHITVEVKWDVPNPVIGDTAHMKANLVGYEDLTYTMQWQYSPDEITWYDIPGETDTTMDVVVTRENNVVSWRILVFVEENQEE